MARSAFGYDLVARSNPSVIRTRTRWVFPTLALMITDVLLAFDHLHNELTIKLAWADEHENFDQAWEAAAERIGAVRESLRGPVPRRGRDRRG